MNKHLKCWAAAGLMALFMGTAAAAPQAMFQKFSIVAEAADTIKDYTVGNFIYTVNETKGTASLKCPIDSKKGTLTSVTVGATVTYATNKTAKITSIGSGAFKNEKKMTAANLTNASNLTTIDAEAFYGCAVLTNITIPAKVTTIGKYCFDGCKKMTKVKFANSTAAITFGMCVFRNCSSLKDVVCGNGTTFALPSGVTAIPQYMFAECTALPAVKIHSGIKTIGTHAFASCNSIKEIKIPNSVTKVDYDAFYLMENLTTVTIGSGVTSLGNHPFYRDDKLTAICVDVANTAYFSFDGVLYTRDRKTLLKYPAAKADTSFKVPAQTKTIEEYAFQKLSNLHTIDFSQTSGLTLNKHNFGTYHESSDAECKCITGLKVPGTETGSALLTKYDCVFRNTSLKTLNGQPLIENLNDTSKVPLFHAAIREAMYQSFEKYESESFMDDYLNAYVKYALKDAYNKYGKAYNSKANISNLSQVEKAYAIYKWVHNQAEYDHDEFDYIYDANGSVIGVKHIYNLKNHNDASLFLHKKPDGKFYTVCDGYSRAYSMIAQAAGLECYCVGSGSYQIHYTDANGNPGYKYESHAFNCVKIGSYYYVVDPTSGEDDSFLVSAKKFRQRWDYFSDPTSWSIMHWTSRHMNKQMKLSDVLLYHFADLNRDGKVDINDKNIIMKHIARISTIPQNMRIRADVNGDGYIDVSDAVRLAVDFHISD